MDNEIDTLSLAIALAAKHHAGQVDKGGNPYILHPLAVMARVDTIEQKTVAVLHDIVEDTPITLANLAEYGFDKEITDAVDALTKRNGESKENAVSRAKHNEIARIVKIADLTENMNISRIPNPTDKDRDRIGRYQKLRGYLLT